MGGTPGAGTPGVYHFPLPLPVPSWSFLSFSFAWPLVRLGSVRQLQPSDLPDLPDALCPAACGRRLWLLWGEEMQGSTRWMGPPASQSQPPPESQSQAQSQPPSQSQSQAKSLSQSQAQSQVTGLSGKSQSVQARDGAGAQAKRPLLGRRYLGVPGSEEGAEEGAKDKRGRGGKSVKPSLLRAMYRGFGWPYVLAGFFKVGQDVISDFSRCNLQAKD